MTCSTVKGLQGQHLVVLSYDYPPITIHDHTKTGLAAWSGLDFDLLAELASILGFTYSVKHVPWTNQTVDEYLHAAVSDTTVDIVGTW